ncbi:MAG: ABC transporter permease [Spirochaetales bacterium]|nr:ABC transporter permease [Spirochaetales bacterium]
MASTSNTNNRLVKYLPFILLIAVSVFFGILYPTFFSIKNVFNLIRQMSFLMIVSMGMTFIILMGSIDASVGANVTFSGVIAALLGPVFGVWAVLFGVLAGALVGLLNGALVIKVKVPSFLVTLAIMGALDGAALLLMNSSPINIHDEGLLNFSNGTLLGNFPNVCLIPIIIVLVSYFIISQTAFGRSLYAIGGNEQATLYSGINVRFMQLIAFVISGATAGLAGCLQASMFEAACPYMGEDILMNAIAAVVIGGTQLSGGVGGPLRTVFGVVLIAVISSGMNFMGLEPATRQIVTGIIMILAVSVNIDRSKMAYVK